MNAITGTTTLTPKADTQGKVIKLKVFWKTTKFWTDSDIADYHKSAKRIAEKLLDEKYWDKNGRINSNRFTCEDFAIRVLCEYAQTKGLPVKLTTGTRTYRNMEVYNPSLHDEYASNIYGFTEAVMLSYGAPDMQRIGQNTLIVRSPENLLPGDILALAHDAKGAATNGRAHHIQVVSECSKGIIKIFQGNSTSTIHRPITFLYKIFGKNAADPRKMEYAGKLIEQGEFSMRDSDWDYKNISTGNSERNYIRNFDLFRWNFREFNK